ncbi:hypothetical protein RUM44_003874 [Polyplax serrata]|uniref:Armadillo repeat-containing protein 7 n=1 Tax=Polyplax serrata TaxID=468196 RepID=A0ABR1B2U4_POLSC
MNPSGRKRTKRSKEFKNDRLEYLDQLVVEFQTSESQDAREQVLANLANFAFDPLNYNYFRTLNILDLFLDNLSNSNENLIRFSVGGLCNLCLDPINKDCIIKNGLNKIISLLGHKNEEIQLSVITTLMFLITPNSKSEITHSSIIKSMLKLSEESNTRLKNLATIFLENYCTEDQIKSAGGEDNSIET